MITYLVLFLAGKKENLRFSLAALQAALQAIRGETLPGGLSAQRAPPHPFCFWFGAARGLSQEWFLTYI